MGARGARQISLLILIASVLVSCQGHVSQQSSPPESGPRTFEPLTVIDAADWKLSTEDLDYPATALALYPVILILIGVIVIPTALLMIVVFAIPLINPIEPEGRQISLATTLSSQLQVAEKILNSDCMERLSCETTHLANSYSRSFANELHNHIMNSTWLSSGIKSRLGRGLDVGEQGGNCQEFQCKPLRGRVGRILTYLEDRGSLWDNLVYYFGGRYLWIRKLAANQGVQFYPYLPNLGRAMTI